MKTPSLVHGTKFRDEVPRLVPQTPHRVPLEEHEAFGRFPEEMKELRKTMQFVKEGPRDDRPAVSELMDRELIMQATPIIRKVVLNPQIARPVFSQCLTLTVVNV